MITIGNIFAGLAFLMSLTYSLAYGFTSAWWRTGFGVSHLLLLTNTSLILFLIPHVFLGSQVLQTLTYAGLSLTLLGSLIQYLKLVSTKRSKVSPEVSD